MSKMKCQMYFIFLYIIVVFFTVTARKVEMDVENVVNELVAKVKDLQKDENELQQEAVKQADGIVKLQEMLLNQSKTDANEISNLNQLIENQTRIAGERFSRLNSFLENQTQTSEDKVVDLKHKIEMEYNQYKANKVIAADLQKAVLKWKNSNGGKVEKLQELLNSAENKTQTTKIKSGDLRTLIGNLEKLAVTHRDRILALEDIGSLFKRNLNSTRVEILVNLSKIASKKELADAGGQFSKEMKSSINEIQDKLKQLSVTQAIDKKKLEQEMSDIVSINELQNFSDNETAVTSAMKLIYSEIIAQQNSSTRHIDQRLKDLELAKGGDETIVNRIQDLRSNLDRIKANVTSLSEKLNPLDETATGALHLWSSNNAVFKNMETVHTLNIKKLKMFVEAEIKNNHPTMK